jgi:hypothetical protein
MQRIHLLLAALCVAAALLAIGLVVRNASRRPLSPLETQLVGEWSNGDGDATRSFWPDRGFSTSDGQYEGRWSIDGDRLILEYWVPFRLREVERLGDFRSKLRQAGRRYTVAWKIEFGADGQTHTLIHSNDHPGDPGGSWKWTRRP